MSTVDELGWGGDAIWALRQMRISDSCVLYRSHPLVGMLLEANIVVQQVQTAGNKEGLYRVPAWLADAALMWIDGGGFAGLTLSEYLYSLVEEGND